MNYKVKLKKQLIRNIVILFVFLVGSSFIYNYGYLSPEEAFREYEAASHFGPSHIVYTLDEGGRIVYLTEYDWWMATFEVRRGFFWLWKSRGTNKSGKFKGEKALEYNWHGSRDKGDGPMEWLFYGRVNDERIKKVTLSVRITKLKEVPENNGNLLDDESLVLENMVDGDHYFLFRWYEQLDEYKFGVLTGYDEHGEILYEEDLMK